MTSSVVRFENSEDSAKKSIRHPQNTMTNDPHRVWPNEILPYQFDDSVGKLSVCYCTCCVSSLSYNGSQILNKNLGLFLNG